MANTPDKISYHIGNDLDIDQVIDLYIQSTLGERRPIHDKRRMTKMIANANLVITAWDLDRLVGIARSLTDFTYCTYLSDLCVHQSYQRMGIGRQLIQRTQAAADQATVFLFSAPKALSYYPHIGMEKGHGFILRPQET